MAKLKPYELPKRRHKYNYKQNWGHGPSWETDSAFYTVDYEKGKTFITMKRPKQKKKKKFFFF